MSHKTDLDDEMAILREAHLRPPFAVLWGVHAAEVPHNKFIHHLLGDSNLGIILLRAMLVEVGEAAISPDDLKSIIEARFQESLGRRQRLDETLVLKSKNGDAAILIIELKVEAAAGEGQLADYRATYEDPKWSKGGRVEGLLLRFTEEPGVRQPTLTLSGFCRALRPLLGREGERVSSGAIHDYYRTCRMLLARERILLADPARLMVEKSGDHWLSAWQEDNWRWACERLLRGVEGALTRVQGGRTGKRDKGIRNAGVTPDYRGAYFNFRCGGGETWCDLGKRVRFVDAVDGDNVLARGFFKVRASRSGVRLEVQTLTEGWPKAPAGQIEARGRLFMRVVDRLDGWGESQNLVAKDKSGFNALVDSQICLRCLICDFLTGTGYLDCAKPRTYCDVVALFLSCLKITSHVCYCKYPANAIERGLLGQLFCALCQRPLLTLKLVLVWK